MIQLRCLLSEDCYVVLPYGIDSMWKDGAAQMHVIGHLGIRIMHSGSTPQDLNVDVPFGRLVQGTQKWGKLRDKGVYHLNASGTVVFSRLAMAATQAYPNYGTNYHFHGRQYSIPGYQPGVLLKDIIEWGTDASFVERWSYPEYTGYHWGYPTTTAGYSESVEESIRFSGTTGIVETRYHIDARERTGYWPSEPALDRRELRFISYDPDEPLSFRRSALFYAGRNESGSWVVSFDSGATTHNLDMLAPCPSTYNVVMGAVNDSFRPAFSGTTGDLVGQFDALVHDLQTPAHRGRIEGMFKLYHPYDNRGGHGYAGDPTAVVLGNLTTQVMKQQKIVDANLFMAALDLANIKSQFRQWKTLSAKLAALPSLLKSLSGASWKQGTLEFQRLTSEGLLSYLYGVIPAVSDMQAVGKSMYKLSQLTQDPNRYHARLFSEVPGPLDSPIQTSHVMTAVVDRLPRDFLEGFAYGYVRACQRLGVYPNAMAAWDAVPFSFVVDWFIRISDAAAAASTKQEVQYFPLDYVCFGMKRTWTPELQREWPYCTGATGSIRYTVYDRSYSTSLPLPPEEAGEAFGSVQHWAESWALIVSHIGRGRRR